MDAGLYTQFVTEGMEWSKLGNTLLHAGLYKEAAVQYKKLLDIKVQLFGRSDKRTCTTLSDYGEAVARGGRLAEGKALVEEAVAHLTASQSHYELKPVKEALDDVLRLERLAGGSALPGDAAAAQAAAAKRPCSYMLCDNDGTRFCTRCRVAWYCSEECQKKDWTGEGTFMASPGLGKLPPSGHKRICGKLAKAMAEAASAR